MNVDFNLDTEFKEITRFEGDKAPSDLELELEALVQELLM